MKKILTLSTMALTVCAAIFAVFSSCSDSTDIPERATKVTITPATLTINKGEKVTLTAAVEGDIADKTVSWVSMNPSVISINTFTGEATAVGGGTATIVAKPSVGSFGEAAITVYAPITGISLAPDTVELYDTYQMPVTIEPSDASDKRVTWSSSNTSVATIAADGKITGLDLGETTITVTSVENSSFTASATVVVVEMPFLEEKLLGNFIGNDFYYSSGDPEGGDYDVEIKKIVKTNNRITIFNIWGGEQTISATVDVVNKTVTTDPNSKIYDYSSYGHFYMLGRDGETSAVGTYTDDGVITFGYWENMTGSYGLYDKYKTVLTPKSN